MSIINKKQQIVIPIRRRSGRGFKTCSSCGEVNGQRATICRNEVCPLRLQILATRRPYDPVQLITYNQTALYSLRKKDHETQPRNFVEISEQTIALESAQSAIVSRKAICFVDTCKYDATNATGLCCKHVNACTNAATNAALPQADVYNVSREVLWNLNISQAHKQSLWQLYKEQEAQVPAVQRLNDNCFAVKCAATSMFPAGRLHVTIGSNTHNCACKKLKIILEPDNSVVMQPDTCDHLLLVLAAVLSQPDGKRLYASFINALKACWMPVSLEPNVINGIEPGMCLGLDINQTAADDNIFIYGNDLMSDDVNTSIPDFNDIIMELMSTNNSPTAMLNQATDCGTAIPIKTSAMNSIEEPVMQENSYSSTAPANDLQTYNEYYNSTVHDNCTQLATQLELSDCNIELMDQFDQLIDQIDLCSDDIALSTRTTELLQTNNFNLLSAAPIAVSNAKESLLKCHLSPMVVATDMNGTCSPPAIELPTIAVVKPASVRMQHVAGRVMKSRKYKKLTIDHKSIESDIKPAHEHNNPVTEPSLAFSAWLDYVVEIMNESIKIHQDTSVLHCLHVHEDIFAYFNKTFSVGVKCRVPNNTTLIKEGRHKGLLKYTWYFTTSSTVRRIFSTKNIALEIERSFECSEDGSFVPYVKRPDTSIPCKNKKNMKRIYPKLALYKAHIWFDCVTNDATGVCANKTKGVKLEWIPNVFPQSHFGIMKISFSLGIKEPQKLPGHT